MASARRNPISIPEPYTKDLRDKIRAYVAENGKPVDASHLPYGWTHSEAQRHQYQGSYDRTGEGNDCRWVVPEGATLVEETYSEFAGTFTDNAQNVGINVTGAHCKCGKFTNITLRVESSLSEVLAYVLNVPEAITEITL